MENIIFSLIQVLIIAITAVFVSTSPFEQDKINSTTSEATRDLRANKDELVKAWPKVFYLSIDQNDPIVCHSGIKLNLTENETTSQQGKDTAQQIFTLSKDPPYPVTCQKAPVPANLTDTFTLVGEENGSTFSNVTWPKLFYLSKDPNDTIVCYSGIKLNLTENENNKTTSQQGKGKDQEIFTLSKDPPYPVTCRKGPVSVNLTVAKEENGGATSNVTCIRRDYEKNISAIFINQTGPLKTAWNVFNNTLTYGFMTAKDSIGSIDEDKVLNDYNVDCEEYGFDTDDKGLCFGTAPSLCG